MSGENLCDEFEKWNPMESHFKSVEFNQYSTGPGANLDLSLQSCQQGANGNGAANKPNVQVPYLLFKHMPPKMTKSALYNICRMHGRVINVRDSQKCDYFFADFATVADMEATFRALENNNYGFQVLVGRHNKKQATIELDVKDTKIMTVPPRTIGIDYENRTYRVSSRLQPRPKVAENRLVERENINGIPSDAINNDAHQLERADCYQPIKHDKFKYHTGRSYLDMNEHTKNFVAKKHGESTGHYNASSAKYVNKLGGIEKPNKFGICIKCESECDSICSRCSTYYCSVDCQKSDWQQHRYKCGKPEHLQKSPPKALPNSPQSNKTETKSSHKTSPSQHDEQYPPQIPRSGNVVTITAISKTNIVFIRAKTYEDDMSYFKTIDGIQALGNRLNRLTAKPKCGNVVIAKFGEQYNRALVLNADSEDKIFVNYMDYGNLVNLKLEDLYEIPEEYAQKPRHAMPVILKDVPDCYMTDEIRKFMYSYLNGINVYIKYKPEDFLSDKQVYQVELLDETTQQNLNKMIIKLSYPTEPRNTTEICYKEYLEQKSLPSGDNIELIVMDNSLMSTGCISCTTKPFAFEIQKFQKELQRYAESLPNKGYAPRVDELCIAKYKEDGLWYRGRCLEIVGDGYPTILFIDYGNISIVHLDDIRRYPTQFTFPIYTADCEINDLPESCGAEIVSKLEELIPNGSTIKCAHIREYKDDHFYSISLPNIVKNLADAGLL
uniref:Tudor domain-containing protein 1 n=1 Tax=Stomoxys calcitrans TaxID=35570 RepID=A0A1I8Q5E5_STOCA